MVAPVDPLALGRALIRCREPEQATEELRGPARLDETLYGMLAREQLGVTTLETRHSDSLDFYELAVWQLRAALEAAFDAGAEAARSTKR